MSKTIHKNKGKGYAKIVTAICGRLVKYHFASYKWDKITCGDCLRRRIR